MWFVTATDRLSAGAILRFQLTNGDEALALAMMLLASEYKVDVVSPKETV